MESYPVPSAISPQQQPSRPPLHSSSSLPRKLSALPEDSNHEYSYPVMGYPLQYNSATSVAMASTTATSHSRLIAPAPSPGVGVSCALPDLWPMLGSGVAPQAGMNSPCGRSPLIDSDEPTHVMGPQGRRGILPSAPGRPPALSVGRLGKMAIPEKDADGRFPCPYCTKDYLHAKHLKRHLLRRKCFHRLLIWFDFKPDPV